MRKLFVRALLACNLVLTVSACSGNVMAPFRQGASTNSMAASSLARAAIPNPALLGINQSTGALEAWRIARAGGRPTVLDPGLGATDGIAMAADGNAVFVARDVKNAVLVYNVTTGEKKTLADPYGGPVDIAVGTDKSIYVANFGTFKGVVVYPQGRDAPVKLPCNLIDAPDWVAVDNDGNVFVNGALGSSLRVVEIPRSGACRDLHLRPELGYDSGLAYDPKTGDLLVMDDPGVCAGPPGARITVYPKPYTKENARSLSYGGSCMTGLRLNASSSLMFFSMPTLVGGIVVFQAGFPDGKIAGRVYSQGDTTAMTTIPNTLPN